MISVAVVFVFDTVILLSRADSKELGLPCPYKHLYVYPFTMRRPHSVSRFTRTAMSFLCGFRRASIFTTTRFVSFLNSEYGNKSEVSNGKKHNRTRGRKYATRTAIYHFNGKII